GRVPPMEPTVAPSSAAAAPGPERVGFGARLGASLIDVVVLCIVGAVASRPLSGPFSRAVAAGMARRPPNVPGNALSPGMLETIIRVTIAITVVWFVYFLLEAFLGRAVGKLILGLRIASEDARPAPVPPLLLRTLIK